jgi:recombination associated protein RdgC
VVIPIVQRPRQRPRRKIMSLLKGNFTFSRFQVEGHLPQVFLPYVNNRIKANAFQETVKSTDEKRWGWVSLTDVLDTDFQHANYALGDYLIFSMRVDRKSVAPSLLKLKVLEEERRFLVESGKEKINKSMANEIKDKVKLQILSKMDPIPAFYDVCWSVGKKVLYFSSLADNVAQDFIELFKTTFALNLKPFSPSDHEFIKTNEESESKNVSIGREFLTWLWFKSEERNGNIRISDTQEVELCFLKRLVLEAGEGEYAQSVLCQGLHADLNEGKEALRQGKKVREARLKIQHNQNEWEFTLKADTFHFQSLKTPETKGEEREEERSGKLLERIYLIEEAVRLLDELYALFLKVRFGPHWESKELKRLHQWLER